MAKSKKKRSFSGVTYHDVRWDGEVPVAVFLIMGDGTEVVVDLPGQTVTVMRGEVKRKKQVWCVQIADFLARQALLKRTEARRKRAAPPGGQAIEFEPRPDPNRPWWG